MKKFWITFGAIAFALILGTGIILLCCLPKAAPYNDRNDPAIEIPVNPETPPETPDDINKEEKKIQMNSQKIQNILLKKKLLELLSHSLLMTVLLLDITELPKESQSQHFIHLADTKRKKQPLTIFGIFMNGITSNNLNGKEKR